MPTMMSSLFMYLRSVNSYSKTASPISAHPQKRRNFLTAHKFPQSCKHGFRETSSSGNQLQKSKEQEPSSFAKLGGGGEVSPQQNSNWDEEDEGEKVRFVTGRVAGEIQKETFSGAIPK